jgi:hypothetical protein
MNSVHADFPGPLCLPAPLSATSTKVVVPSVSRITCPAIHPHALSPRDIRTLPRSGHRFGGVCVPACRLSSQRRATVCLLGWCGGGGGGRAPPTPATAASVRRADLCARRETPEVTPDGCLIDAPWLVNGGHGASLPLVAAAWPGGMSSSSKNGRLTPSTARRSVSSSVAGTCTGPVAIRAQDTIWMDGNVG